MLSVNHYDWWGNHKRCFCTIPGSGGWLRANSTVRWFLARGLVGFTTTTVGATSDCLPQGRHSRVYAYFCFFFFQTIKVHKESGLCKMSWGFLALWTISIFQGHNTCSVHQFTIISAVNFFNSSKRHETTMNVRRSQGWQLIFHFYSVRMFPYEPGI